MLEFGRFKVHAPVLGTFALDGGAMGASISGAGPSVLAWCESKADAERVADAMAAAFADAGFGSDRLVTPISAQAARVLA